ncbi:MAG: hypothetical protein M1831_000196 [Alyxoria varia]|nr:MAG: hypothetical protein M1831_000196 [Alyxoria varia]
MTAVPTSMPSSLPSSLANVDVQNLAGLGIGSSGLPNTFSKIDEDRGTPIVVYNAIFIAIPTICVILRFWSRAISPRSERKFQWDDWVTLAALPFTILQSALTIQWVNIGLGQHMMHVPTANLSDGLLLLWIGIHAFTFGVALARFAAILFYARVFRPISKQFRWSLWIIGVLNTGWIIGSFFSATFRCIPVHVAWHPLEMAMGKGSCFDIYKFLLGTAVTSVVLDLYILLLPMPTLWGLQTKWAKKLLIGLVFACGYCVIVISIGRVVSVSRAHDGLRADLTWNFSVPLYWYAAETPVSIMSVCLPSIFHLCRRGIQHGPGSLFNDREYPPPSPSKPSLFSSWRKLASFKSSLFKSSLKSGTNRSAASPNSSSSTAPCEKCGHVNDSSRAINARSHTPRNALRLKNDLVTSTVDSLADFEDTEKSVDRDDVERNSGRSRNGPPLAAIPQMWPASPPPDSSHIRATSEKHLPSRKGDCGSPLEDASRSRSIGAGGRGPSTYSPYPGSNASTGSPTWSNSPTSPTGYRRVPPWHHRVCVRRDVDVEEERSGDSMA